MPRLRLLFLLLASSLSHSDFSGCPTLPATRTCTCSLKTKGLDLSCDSATKQDLLTSIEAIARTHQVVWYLKFRNVHLGNFDRSLLGDLRVNHFIALNCSVTSIEDDAFAGLADDLESLDLGQNKLERVPTAAFEGLVNLASLNLNYNRIEILHAEAFRGLISLLRLSLFGNRIKFVDDLAFDGIGGNLTQVNLGDNGLSSVPSRPLRNLDVLQRLQLHENKIGNLLEEEFRGMGESLDVLELSGNQVEKLPERAFANLKMLNSLDLENNQIRYIHPKAFEGIESSLEWLKLGDNQLSSIPAEPLRRLKKLRQLDLRQNRIDRITEDDFKHYGRTLKFIYLQKNSSFETSALAATVLVTSFHAPPLSMWPVLPQPITPAEDLGSNPGEDMDVCKCIVPSRHEDTLNSRRAASPIVRSAEREERWEASDHPRSGLPLYWSGTDPNRTITFMVLKATVNDWRHLALCHDEFRGP
ncbi:leucine-rich repeat-containing protein let-4 [Trichonephila clavipes]|nr:leucine-rich repeat-containing protein let-4 [Trichonephila clavipes]